MWVASSLSLVAVSCFSIICVEMSDDPPLDPLDPLVDDVEEVPPMSPLMITPVITPGLPGAGYGASEPVVPPPVVPPPEVPPPEVPPPEVPPPEVPPPVDPPPEVPPPVVPPPVVPPGSDFNNGSLVMELRASSQTLVA